MTTPPPDSGDTAEFQLSTGEALTTLYGALNDRVGDRDSMMWQAPAMAMTAQAFLLTIALGQDTSTLARLLSALLGVVVTIMSIQLMLKHKFFMTTDQVLLIALENRMGLPSSAVEWETQVKTINGDTSTMNLPMRIPRRAGLLRWPSVNIWVGGLSAFAAVNILILILVGAEFLGLVGHDFLATDPSTS